MVVSEEAPGGQSQSQLDGAFDVLFAREYGRVTAIASQVLGSRSEAEDVAQDVFLSALRYEVVSRERPEAWLHAAAVHLALNRVREGRRRLGREQRALGRGFVGPAPSHPAAADPAQTAEAREQRARIQALLARIPPRQAAVLVLRLAGLSYADVARALGMPIGSVATTLRRAEVSARKEFSDHAPF